MRIVPPLRPQLIDRDASVLVNTDLCDRGAEMPPRDVYFKSQVLFSSLLSHLSV